MSLLEQRPEGILTIRQVQPGRITVEARELERSFLLAPDALVEDWGPASFEYIDEAAMQSIIALQPQLVILGSGQRQRFLPPRLQALLLRQGIGIESMDNGAAARTYNLLALEGRRAVAAFVLEASAASAE
jgi:uncharacterized protein